MNQITPAAAAFILTGLVAVILLIRAVWEIRQLTVSQIVVKKINSHSSIPAVCSAKNADQAACLSAKYIKKISSRDIVPDADLQAFRIIQLSDLHVEHLSINHARLIETISAARPDLIVFTGDLTGNDKYIAKGLAFLSAIRQHKTLSAVPFAAVPGNHDTDETIAGMKTLGIIMLTNAHCSFSSPAGPVQIVGLDDLRTGLPSFETAIRTCLCASDTAAAENKLPGSSRKTADNNAYSSSSCTSAISSVQTGTGDSCHGYVPDSGHRVILAHNPDSVFTVPEKAASLMLTGHFHGGQIWMPFRFEFIMLREEKMPRIGITRGLNYFRGQQLFISRGLGCVSIPLRLFSLPELTIIDLLQEESNDTV